MSNAFKHIRVQETAEVLRVTLDRPPLNVLNIAMMEEMHAAIERARGLPHLRALVFDAAGKAFSAGVEVGEHMGDLMPKMLDAFHGIFHLLGECDRPTIAVVQGAALGGGCELAAFCDLVLASEQAKFGQPEIKVGVFPPVAAAVFPRLMGWHQAMELLLTGDSVDAATALQLGLVNRVVPADQLEGALQSLLASLREKSGLVLGMTKRALLAGAPDFAPSLHRVEELYGLRLMRTRDATEGLQAFLDKRKPVWEDR
jgi:cyclohexa-1,5-dienecarbonyl-CoA hydratase